MYNMDHETSSSNMNYLGSMYNMERATGRGKWDGCEDSYWVGELWV